MESIEAHQLPVSINYESYVAASGFGVYVYIKNLVVVKETVGVGIFAVVIFIAVLTCRSFNFLQHAKTSKR
jgi:hypothetical protein